MSLFENHAGFNLTTRKLQLVEVINNDRNFFLENVDEVSLNETIDLNFTETQLINILQNSFKELTNKKSLKSKIISIALSHDYFKICQIPYDTTLLEKDLLEYLNFEFSLLYPDCSIDDYILRHYDVNKGGLLNNRTTILIAVNKKIIHALHQFSRENGLKLKYVDNEHVASNSFILLDNLAIRNQIVGSILADDNYISLIILDEKNPVYFRTRKINCSDELLGALKKEIEGIKNIDLSINSVSRWFIGGDLACDDFIESSKNELKLSIYRYNPLDKIKISPHIYENENFIEKYYSFTAAAGMALRII